jgi:hypothetical protein
VAGAVNWVLVAGRVLGDPFLAGAVAEHPGMILRGPQGLKP